MLTYSSLWNFILISFAIALLIFALSYLIASQTPDAEKFSAYECGFQSFGDTRGKFDVKFYLVAILFIIFDIEIAFVYPWLLVVNSLDFQGFYLMCGFLIILTCGFIYELFKGALNW